MAFRSKIQHQNTYIRTEAEYIQ